MAGGTPNCVAESRSILARRYDLRPRHRRHRPRQQPDDRRRRESRPLPRLALWTIAPRQACAVRTDVSARGGEPLAADPGARGRSEEHTSELQSLMRISYAVFCLNKKNNMIKDMTSRTSRYTR